MIKNKRKKSDSAKTQFFKNIFLVNFLWNFYSGWYRGLYLSNGRLLLYQLMTFS